MAKLQEIFSIVWNETIFDASVGQIVIAAIVLFVFILLRRFFARVVIARLQKWAASTATNVDDRVLAALQQPIMFLFFILGLAFVVQWLPFGGETEKILVTILESLIALTIFWTIYRILDPISILFDRFLIEIAGGVANEVKDYLLKALKVFVIGSGIVAVLAQWGIDPWPYFAGIGVLSLPFAFAAKDTVANMFGGIKLLIVDNVFRVGDWIETPSIGHGIVEEITLSTVKVRKFNLTIQTVPNGVIASEPITNWSRASNRRVKIDLGLAYCTTFAQFEKILRELREFIANDDRVDHSVTQMVHMTEFSQSSIDINLYYFTKSTKWEEWRATVEEHMLEFIRIIEGSGATIAFPTRTIHVEGVTGLSDENHVKLQTSDI